MPAKSVNLDMDILTWLDEQAKKEGHSVSFIINHYLRKAKIAFIKDKPRMLRCDKHEEPVEYSEILPMCPLCAEIKTKHDIEDHDLLTITRRNELNQELALVNETMGRLSAEINALEDPMNKDKEKNDQLIKEFDDAAIQKREITAQLANLL